MAHPPGAARGAYTAGQRVELERQQQSAGNDSTFHEQDRLGAQLKSIMAHSVTEACWILQRLHTIGSPDAAGSRTWREAARQSRDMRNRRTQAMGYPSPYPRVDRT